MRLAPRERGEVTNALPIIPDQVRCDPYRTVLSPASCVARFRLANTEWSARDADAGVEGKGAGGVAAATALYRQSDCAGCCVGAERSWYYDNGGIEVMTDRRQSPVKKCPQCGEDCRRLENTPNGPMCRGCKSGGAGKLPKKQRIARAVERSETGPVEEGEPVVRYMVATAKIEALRLRHEKEMRTAMAQLAQFEETSRAATGDDVREQARDAFQRIFERPRPALARAVEVAESAVNGDAP